MAEQFMALLKTRVENTLACERHVVRFQFDLIAQWHVTMICLMVQENIPQGVGQSSLRKSAISVPERIRYRTSLASRTMQLIRPDESPCQCAPVRKP